MQRSAEPPGQLKTVAELPADGAIQPMGHRYEIRKGRRGRAGVDTGNARKQGLQPVTVRGNPVLVARLWISAQVNDGL